MYNSVLLPYFSPKRKQENPKIASTNTGNKRFFWVKKSISNRYGMNARINPVNDGKATGHSGADSHFMICRGGI